MSSGEKNAPNLVGFPTPDDAAGEDAYLLFLFPADEAYAQLLLGALEPMVYPYNWYESGNLLPDEAAEKFRQIIEQAPYNTYGDVPTPFWDEESGDDTDDTAPKNDQDWYGEIVIIDDNLTFVENIGIYIIAGFMAYSGAVGAAIAFVPFARNFVVKFRTNPLGGLINFFANGQQIGQVDTYSAADGVIEAPIAMPAPVTGFVAESVTYPTFWCVLSDQNPHDLESVSMSLIRSQLSEGDFAPKSLRYNPDTDTVEYTPDGGTTWNPAPESDPRSSMTLRLPPRGGTSVDCDSAANMVKWLHDFLDQLIAAGALVGEILFVVNLLLDFLDLLDPLFGVILDIITSAASAIATYGSALIDAAFTPTVYDQILCIFFCNMDADGSVNAAQLANMQSDATAQLTTTAADIFNLILSVQGETGVTNAGRIGSETGDCSACDCTNCYTWDFHTTDGAGDGWGAAAGFSGYAHYDAGFGWRSVSGLGLVLGIAFSSTEIVSIEYAGQFSGASGENISFYWRSGGATLHTTNQSPAGASGHFQNIDTQDLTIDEIWCNPSGGSFSQQLIEWVKIHYRGDNPGWTEGEDC